MGSATTEKLGASVGAEVVGVDCERLLADRGVMHRACPYDRSSPRDMHRTTLHGDETIR